MQTVSNHHKELAKRVGSIHAPKPDPLRPLSRHSRIERHLLFVAQIVFDACARQVLGQSRTAFAGVTLHRHCGGYRRCRDIRGGVENSAWPARRSELTPKRARFNCAI